MRLLIDMNLSPARVTALGEHGIEAEHWSRLGPAHASDRELFDFARHNGWVVLTHDLDFGAILAATLAEQPRVIQFRTDDLSPHVLCERLVRVLERFAEQIEAGVLSVIDEARERVRLLPLSRN